VFAQAKLARTHLDLEDFCMSISSHCLLEKNEKALIEQNLILLGGIYESTQSASPQKCWASGSNL
jgi:hypothetical protein